MTYVSQQSTGSLLQDIPDSSLVTLVTEVPLWCGGSLLGDSAGKPRIVFALRHYTPNRHAAYVVAADFSRLGSIASDTARNAKKPRHFGNR